MYFYEIPAEDPGRYSQIDGLLHDRGWSWRDVAEAPIDYIEECLYKRRARIYWQNQKENMDKAFQRNNPA